MENIRDKWAFSNGNWTISIRNKKTSKEKTMVRIEMQLTEEEVAIIEQIAKEESRSRKKQCEVYVRKMISDYKRKRSN